MCRFCFFRGKVILWSWQLPEKLICMKSVQCEGLHWQATGGPIPPAAVLFPGQDRDLANAFRCSVCSVQRLNVTAEDPQLLARLAEDMLGGVWRYIYVYYRALTTSLHSYFYSILGTQEDEKSSKHLHSKFRSSSWSVVGHISTHKRNSKRPWRMKTPGTLTAGGSHASDCSKRTMHRNLDQHLLDYIATVQTVTIPKVMPGNVPKLLLNKVLKL